MSAHDVPDLAYGDAPDSFDSPDGRTYSEPVTAATPGQAAYEAYAMAAPDDMNFPVPDSLDAWERDAWEAAGQAAYEQRAQNDAAQEPHAAAGIPLRSDAETAAMLRADLADAEAQLARWPKCPAGCSCRTGIEDDPDRNECGCDGPCNGGEQAAPELADYEPGSVDLPSGERDVREIAVRPAPELAAAMRQTASRELAAAMAEARGYRDALQLIRGRENDPIAQVRHVARIAKRALGGKP